MVTMDYEYLLLTFIELFELIELLELLLFLLFQLLDQSFHLLNHVLLFTPLMLQNLYFTLLCFNRLLMFTAHTFLFMGTIGWG